MKYIVGLVAALSLAAVVAIQAFDLSIARLLAPGAATESSGPVTETELEALFEGSPNPQVDAYLKALKAVFPEDYAALLESLKKRARAGDDDKALEAAANAEAVAIARANSRSLPYADPDALKVFFEGQVHLLEFARSAFGDEACVEAARHGGASINARIMRQPPSEPLLISYLDEVIASHRKLLFVMKAGREAGARELPKPEMDDWRALANAMRALGAEKAHFDAIDHPDQPVEDKVLCEAALMKAQALATLEGSAGSTLRPYLTKSMVGE